MKKYIVILILSLGALVSCDNFLTIIPTGEVVPESLEEYRALITRAYTIISARNASITAFRSDEINMAPAASADKESYLDIWIWKDADPSETTVDFEWVRFYNAIYIANQIIENEKRIVNGTQAEIDQLIGEAVIMRAYVHFILVNLYGKPFGTTSSTDKAVPIKHNTNTEEILNRNTVAELYDFIEKDLEEAEKRLNVNGWDQGLNYRFNSLSVDAFRSRLYLYKKEWSASLNASEKLLAQKDTLADLRSSREVVPNHYKSPESIVALDYMINNYSKVGVVNLDLINMYKTGDQRKSKYYQAQTATAYNLIKGGYNDYCCTFRTGEIYLNAAEAEWHLDNLDNAKKYLLELLEKRYTVNGYNTAKAVIDNLGKEDFIAYLYDERFKELAFEGHRWFDLRRTTQERLEKRFDGVTYVLEQNDPRYTLRIPTEAILSNPNLAN